jgi:hypothetical protein
VIQLPQATATTGDDTGRPAALRAAEWLSFAAAPTFALMALFTGIPDGGVHEMSCSGATHLVSLGGMAPMYALMSAFHLRTWLRFVSGRRGATDACIGGAW